MFRDNGITIPSPPLPLTTLPPGHILAPQGTESQEADIHTGTVTTGSHATESHNRESRTHVTFAPETLHRCRGKRISRPTHPVP